MIGTVANRERGEIGVDIDGRRYTLVLNTNAMALLEEHFSTPAHDATWDEILPKLTRKPSVRSLRAVVWAMLQEKHATQFPTIAEASRFVDLIGGVAGLGRILERAGASVSADPRDVTELQEGANPPAAQGDPRDGTGDRSFAVPVVSA